MKLPVCLCMLIVACLLAFSAENVDAAIRCYDCHGTSVPVDYRPVDASFRNPSSGGFQGNHRTHMDATATPTVCSICHPGSSSYTASHRDGLIKVSSRINGSPLTTLYKNTTTAWAQTANPFPMGNCSNVNCHFEAPTPTWGNDPAQTNCGTCHGAPPSGTATAYVGGAAGSHAKHDQYYPGSTNCKKCHPDNTTFKHATSGKRALKISFAAAPNNGSGSYSGPLDDYLPSQTNVFGNCTATYCHSPGTKATGFIAPIQTATWGGTLGCDGCHAAAPVSGSHSPHVVTGYGVPVACYKCHAATVTSGMTISSTTKHVNGLINVAFDSTTTAVLGKYSSHLTPMQKNPGSGYANCENVYCHSSGQGAGGSWPPTYSAPKWGSSATGKCGTCHDSGFHAGAPIASGSHTKHLLYDFAGASAQNPCGVCHYGAGFTDTACAQCHFGGGKLTTLHVNHQVDVSFTTKFSGTYSGTPEPGNGYSSCSNVYCHSSGTSVATGSIPANTTAAWGSGAISCSGCHGNPPSYANNSPKKNSHVIHGAYGCNKCHYRTTTNGTSITNTTNHVNKVYDVYSGAGARFTYVYNASGGACNSISCHGTTNAQWGATACLGCHSVAQGNRVAITSQFGANSHHIQGAVTDAKCYQCHWEANIDGTINPLYHGGTAASGSSVDLVVYGSGARPASYSLTGTVTAVQYHYTTNANRAGAQKITTHCLGCHSDQNNTATPFGDGKTPKQYAWDGTSVAARYSQSGTTSWGKYTSASYSNTAKKKISKAFSSHGNTAGNQRGWDITNAISNTSGSVNVECYDCHNSHGSTVAGITSRYSSASGRQRGAILKDTVAGKGGYSIAYKPYTGGSVANKNKHQPGASICIDCHMTQNAGSTTPWGYTSTFGATQGILGYWDSPYYGPGTFGPQSRNNFKSTGNMGGHFGVSSSLSNQASMAIDGLCTPCHDPHGVSPTLGNKQQYSVPLLKGTWITSPYKEDTAPAVARLAGQYPDQNGLGPASYHIDQNTFGSSLGGTIPASTFRNVSTASGLCLGCHPKNSLTDGTTHTWKSKDRIHESVNGWKTANGTIKHNYSCSKCHAVHNSRLPRLMVTDCLDGQHKGRSGFNGQARLYGGTSVSGYNGSGSGSGRIPGIYGGSGSGGYYYPSEGPAPGSFGVTCHESPAANNGANSNLDQGWNVKTPWNNAGAPTEVSAMPGNTQITISWTAGTGPSSSLIRYGTATGAYGAPIDPATSPRLITGLANGQTIYYQVGAKNGGVTTWSAEYIVTPNAPPPAAPTGISATPGNTQVTISWTAGAGSSSSLIRYGTTTGVYGTPIDPATSPRTIAGLTNGQTIYYQVGAKNTGGTAWSDEASVTPAGLPTLTSPTATAIDSTTATLGANLTSNGGVAVTARGTAWGPAASPTGNAVAEGGTATGVFTHGRTALTAGTKIFYRGYATNSTGTAYSPDGSFYTEPSTQASGVNFTPVGTTGMTVNWTRGTGDGVIVLMKQGSAVSSNPVEGTYTTYTANAAFGSGTQIGTGNYVIYKNTGTSVAVTGLTAGTTYYVAVYEYKGTVNTSGADQGTNYKQTPITGSQATITPTAPTLTSPTATAVGSTTATLGANLTSNGGAAITARGTVWGTAANPTGNALAEGGTATSLFTHGRTSLTAGTRIYYRGYATNNAGTGYSPGGSFYTEPSTQASAIGFTSISTTAMTVSWTRGNGDGVIVLMKQGSAVNSDPVDGTYTTYTANAAFGSGTQIGTGNYVVYKGTGTNVAVTGLAVGTTYYVAVYEYKGTVDTSGADQGTNYKPAPTTGSQATSTGGGSNIVTFNYTGAFESISIPAGATNIQFTVIGAGGGGGRTDENSGEGGLNGHSVVTSYGTSGVTLYIYVGSGGQLNDGSSAGAGGVFGYNPGGAGGNGEDNGDGNYAFGGSSGGGSSAITLSGGTLLAEAMGGAGGKSSDWSGFAGGAGGAGGGVADYPSTTSSSGGGAGGGADQAGGNGQVVITYDY